MANQYGGFRPLALPLMYDTGQSYFVFLVQSAGLPLYVLLLVQSTELPYVLLFV